MRQGEQRRKDCKIIFTIQKLFFIEYVIYYCITLHLHLCKKQFLVYFGAREMHNGFVTKSQKIT